MTDFPAAAADGAAAAEGAHEARPAAADDDGFDWRGVARPLARGWTSLVAAVVVAGALGAGGSFLITPEYTSTTSFIPPQQQGGAASALASLGALAGLAGAAAGLKSPAEQYVSLMQSVTVSDRIIDRFGLMKVYDTKYRSEARLKLAEHVQMTLGKKDGLISVAVSDVDAARAARIANQFVEELRRMTSTLAVSEAQQRRAFFEKQMQETQAHLIAAQSALQESGFSAGAIKTEPRAAAEQYARLRAEATATEVRLQTLRSSLADTAPEVRQAMAQLAALNSQLDQLSARAQADAGAPDYVTKYREFKYQETLFELMSKQYELARIDESREGELIQVVDAAQPSELKSKPRRSLMAIGAALAAGLLMAVRLVVRSRRRPGPAT
jgi:uncharacterized protein involved in exopolysaccharide biosynthesis